MSQAAQLDRFGRAVVDHDAALTRTTAAEFDAALADAVESPAVGTPLRYDEVSLDGADVDLDPTPRQLENARTGVTPVAFAIAGTGTVAVPSTDHGEEPVSLYPERHVAVVRERDVLADSTVVFDHLEGSRPSVVLATGPSATGDMGALVTGVHGPGEVHVILVEEGAP